MCQAGTSALGLEILTCYAVFLPYTMLACCTTFLTELISSHRLTGMDFRESTAYRQTRVIGPIPYTFQNHEPEDVVYNLYPSA